MEATHDQMSHHVRSDFRKFLKYISITPLGLAVLIMGGWVYQYFGQDEQDFLLYMSGFISGAFVLLFNFFAYLEWWRLKRAFQNEKSTSPQLVKVEVGQDLLTGFSLASIPLNPLFQLFVNWSKPTAKEYHLELFAGRLHELIKPQRRGRVVEVTREFRLEDIFGLTSLTWSEKEICDLHVLPQSTPANELRLKRPQQGEDFYDPIGETQGDLIEMRRYEDGDPLKWVMWRVYARNRQLIVRSPERALSEKKDLVAYFMADSSDEASASTARAYLDNGLLGEEFIFFADGCIGQARQPQEVMEHLLSSANGQVLSALPALLALPPQQLQGVVIFASAIMPIESLLTVISALPTHPTVILSLPYEVTNDEHTSTWWATLFKPKKKIDSRTLNIQHVVNTVDILSQKSPPIVVAQPSGRELSYQLLTELSAESDNSTPSNK